MGEQGDIFAAEHLPTVHDLTVVQYQSLAAGTDKLKDTEYPLDLPFLGLLGEVGGTVAEVKKHRRGDRPNAAYTAAVKQELGDALWYCAALCRRLDLDFSLLAAKATKRPEKDAHSIRFADIQRPFAQQARISEEELLFLSIQLTEKTGKLISAYSSNRKDFGGPLAEVDFIELIASMFEMGTVACISLQETAMENLQKIFDRWPIHRNYPVLLDAGDKEIERFPRKLTIDIFEREVAGKTLVYQRCNGINIGDPLTDNKEDEDDYRFHDVFHYA